jgi:hypothetical protein
MGWAALVATPCGVLAHTSGALVADFPSSWAAEWIGKLEGILLARRLGVPDTALAYVVADNVSASLGAAGGSPSGCAWVDALRLAFAATAARSGLVEVFTPAQHDTGWDDLLAGWQAACDSRARDSLPRARESTRPCPEVITDSALLYRGGRLVLQLAASLDAVYENSPRAAHRPPVRCPRALLAWQELVCAGKVSAGGLRLAFWLRDARVFHVSERNDLPCPLCGTLCHGWGWHLWERCPMACGAALRGFRAVVAELSTRMPVTWITSTTVRVQWGAGAPSVWCLARDDHASLHPDKIVVTWSGLIAGDLVGLTCATAAGLSRVYLDAASRWLDLEPALRWMSAVTPVPLGLAGPDVTHPIVIVATILLHVGGDLVHACTGPLSGLVGELTPWPTPPPALAPSPQPRVPLLSRPPSPGAGGLSWTYLSFDPCQVPPDSPPVAVKWCRVMLLIVPDLLTAVVAPPLSGPRLPLPGLVRCASTAARTPRSRRTPPPGRCACSTPQARRSRASRRWCFRGSCAWPTTVRSFRGSSERPSTPSFHPRDPAGGWGQSSCPSCPMRNPSTPGRSSWRLTPPP